MAEVTPGAVAPVVPVVPASTDAPAPGSTAEPVIAESTEQPAAPDTQKEESDRAFQKRLGIEKRRLERALRAEIERDFLKSQLESRDRPQTAQPTGEPQQKDFSDYEEYLLARAEWRFEQKQAKQRESQQRETQTQQQQRQLAERVQYVQQNLVAKGVAKYGNEFSELVMSDPSTPITEVMVAAATRLTNGADVLYHLAKNDPDELQRIANLPDVEQAWEIKDAGSKLTASPAPTRTPAPIVPNAGKASVRKETFALSVNNSQEWDEFVKRRHKELGRR